MDKFNKIMVLFILFLSATVGWEGYVLAIPAPSTPVIITPGGMATDCDELIYVDGSTILARDSTGDNVYSGSDAATVFQSAITAAPMDGMVCISSQLTLNSGVIVNKKETITGMSGPSSLSSDPFTIIVNCNCTAIEIDAPSVRITGMSFKAQTAGQGTGVGFSQSIAFVYDSQIDNSGFINLYIGIDISPVGSVNHFRERILGDVFNGNIYGVFAYANSAVHLSNNIRVEDSFFRSNTNGIKAGNEADAWIITGNTFNTSPILFTGTQQTGEIITNNYISSNTATSAVTVFKASIVSNNYFDANTFSPVLSLTSSNNRVLSNIFDTSNTATFNFQATSAVAPYNYIAYNRFSATGKVSADNNNVFELNINFNPFGKITNPFGTDATGLKVIDLAGSSSTPVIGQQYVIAGTDMYVNSTSNGQPVTIYDTSGTQVYSTTTGLLMVYIKQGYRITWSNSIGTIAVYGN